MAHFSVELPDDVADALRAVASGMQSSPERLLAEAARGLLAEHAALEATIARGEADIAAGRVVEHEVVMAELRQWAQDLRTRSGA